MRARVVSKMGSTSADGSVSGLSTSPTVPKRSRLSLSGDVNATPSFLILYFAVGLLMAEAAGGLVLFTVGGSLLKNAPTTPASSQVPNGAARTFNLTAYMTGFVGAGGSINGVRDPTITVAWGDFVTISVANGEGMIHNLHLDGYNVGTASLAGTGATGTIHFQATQQGTFAYYCSIPGHREAGMVGSFSVGTSVGPTIGPEAPLTVASIARDPAALPPPIARNYSTTVNIYLHAEEVTAEIEPGTSFSYWTYNGTVPGPFFRVRVDDTVMVHFSNDANSTMNHSVDFHAATGPGGGGQISQTAPGGWTNFSFKALVPGLFVYHCASPNIPTHLAMGMYGLLLVEPGQGLPIVDHEFYLMQGELYTMWPMHTKGNQMFNGTALLNEDPTYVVFNGAYDALTGPHQMNAAVNDTVRLFVGVGGPDVISSFHMIGAMFDDVYADGDLIDAPLHGLQTVMIAPGSAATLDFMTMYPAKYPLVDHALVNAIDKGALAILNVSGWANSSIFQKYLVDGPGAGSTASPTPANAARSRSGDE
jgi:nitrite reductase (NO-forming)